MRLLENSPVLAAFGVAHDAAEAARPLARPAAAGDDNDDDVLAGLGAEALARAPPASRSHAPVVVELDVYLCPAACARADAALARPGTAAELPRLAAQLVASTLVSHGSWWHVLMERLLGIDAHASIHARSGGMTMHRWLSTYFACLAAAAPGLRVAQPAHPPPPCGVGSSAVAEQATPLLSVFLDVKSTRASAGALRLLVDGLNALGVHVWGVGSFRHAQLAQLLQRPRAQALLTPLVPARAAAVSGGGRTQQAQAQQQQQQQLDAFIWLHHRWAADETDDVPYAAACERHGLLLASARLPAPLPLHLFTFVGELQHACDRGLLPHGASVLFNGGTMLQAGPAPGTFSISERLLAELECYRQRHELRLGCYAQEPLLAADAADALVRTANNHPALLEHGFAFSGLSGVAASDTRGPGCRRVPCQWLGWLPVAAPWRFTTHAR